MNYTLDQDIAYFTDNGCVQSAISKRAFLCQVQKPSYYTKLPTSAIARS